MLRNDKNGGGGGGFFVLKGPDWEGFFTTDSGLRTEVRGPLRYWVGCVGGEVLGG